jgi:hypothetical protein
MPNAQSKKRGVVRRRPAESTAAAGGLAGLAVAITSGDTVTVVVALLGFVPACVTYLVANGGVRGVAGSLLGAKAT